MAYVIVDVNAGVEYKMYWNEPKLYRTEKGAKTACTKLNKKSIQQTSNAPWSVMESQEWSFLKCLKFPSQRVIKRVNLMSGQEYWEDAETPLHLSPASETYWSR